MPSASRSSRCRRRSPPPLFSGPRPAARITSRTTSSPAIGWPRPARPVRILRGTIDRDLDTLVRSTGGLDKVADALIAGDPEIDLETFGTFLGGTSRVYLDPDHQMVTHVDEWEVVRNPDGTEKE